MKNKAVFYLLFFLLASTFGTIAQDKGVGDAVKKQINYYIQQSNEWGNQNNTTALLYAKKALVISKQSNNDTILAKVYNTLANCYEHKVIIDSAIMYHTKALFIRKKLKNKLAIGDSYNNLGICNELIDNFENALKYYLSALAVFESQNSKSKQAMVLANIGILYKQQKSYTKALDYYKKANLIYAQIGDKFGTTATNGNIGSVLLNLKQYEKSIAYSQKAQRGYTDLRFANYIPYSISNIAMAHDSLGNFAQAELKYKESILGHKKSGNDYEIANVLNAYAKNLLKQKKYFQSIEKSNEAQIYIEKTNSEKLRIAQLKNMSEAYAAVGKYKEAFQFSQQYNTIKDTLFEKEKAKAVFELEAKYQTAKKDVQLSKSKSIILERERRIMEQTKLFYLVLGLAFLLALVGFLVYKQQRLKNKQIVKENELKQALVKIENQNNLQQQRLSISKDLHDNIGAQLTFIISSLDNLKYFDFTKEKLYPKLDTIVAFTRATITDLRDTIWAMNKESITYEDLKIRTTNFIESANSSVNGIHFTFENVHTAAHTSFNTLVGIDIYRIIQEAVNNAIKHARATVVSVTFSSSNEQLEIGIQDNGLGFDPESIAKGNGLLTMQKRANEIHADFSIEQMQPGTKVTLKFNVH